MSADGVADQVVKRLGEQRFPFVMNNFAPPDMVGHTGVYEAAIVGCEATDKAIGKILEACKKEGYILFITSDHGNAEEMKFADGKPKTSHNDQQGALHHGQRARGLEPQAGGRRAGRRGAHLAGRHGPAAARCHDGIVAAGQGP